MSPGASMRSPSGVRSVGVPETTTRNSSQPSSQWYGQSFSPGGVS